MSLHSKAFFLPFMLVCLATNVNAQTKNNFYNVKNFDAKAMVLI